MDRLTQQDIDYDQRQQAADRLMNHLLQKGRPAPYKERLIGGFANPATGRMPEALIPIPAAIPLESCKAWSLPWKAGYGGGWNPINRKCQPAQSKLDHKN